MESQSAGAAADIDDLVPRSDAGALGQDGVQGLQALIDLRLEQNPFFARDRVPVLGLLEIGGERVRPVVHHPYPLTPPTRMPSTMKRQTIATSTTEGSTARKIALFRMPQETSTLRASEAMTTESGRFAASPESTSANR